RRACDGARFAGGGRSEDRREDGPEERARQRRARAGMVREGYMTVAEVHELFAYNAWANRRIFAALRARTAGQYFRGLKSSHAGIHGTVCHIVWAEQLWLRR